MAQPNDTPTINDANIEKGAQKAVDALLRDGVEFRIARLSVNQLLFLHGYSVESADFGRWYGRCTDSPYANLGLRETYHDALDEVIAAIRKQGGAK